MENFEVRTLENSVFDLQKLYDRMPPNYDKGVIGTVIQNLKELLLRQKTANLKGTGETHD